MWEEEKLNVLQWENGMLSLSNEILFSFSSDMKIAASNLWSFHGYRNKSGCVACSERRIELKTEKYI